MKTVMIWISCAFTCLCLSACSDSPPAPVKSVVVPVESNLPARVKPGLNISLPVLQQKIPEGVPAEIDLALFSHVPDGEIEVTITLPETLELLDGDLQRRFTMPERNIPIALTVYGREEGKHYITLQARHLSSGTHRVLSAIIWVGEDVELLKSRAAASKKSDRSNIDMQAEETIYPGSSE